MTTPPEKRQYSSPEEAARIYLLPNLFTAGNMLCGFLAIKNCIEARFTSLTPDGRAYHYNLAVWFILFACVCDLFDGRVARATKRESLFGAEFDSIADTVSFGVAPEPPAPFSDPVRIQRANELGVGSRLGVSPAVGLASGRQPSAWAPGSHRP